MVVTSESEVGHSSDIDTSGVSVVQVATLGGQPIQVQSVIHGKHPSVIQTASGQYIHAIQVTGVGSDGDNGDEDAETRKRRDILARRPSYRKILNELSSPDGAPTITVAKIEEEDSPDSGQDDDEDEEEATNLSTSHGIPLQSVVPGTIQLATHPDSTSAGLQTLTMTNAAQSTAGGATIVQYAQAADGQFFIPAGNVQYQIAPTSLSQGVVMATAAGSTIATSQQLTEEASRKRELRLLKNREAARECRRKKKDYVKCLENRVAVLENQNKTLIEELKSLKELYCQKEAQS